MRLMILAACLACSLTLTACDSADSAPPDSANLAPMEDCRHSNGLGGNRYFRTVNGVEYEISETAYYGLCNR